jgi:hypothetical protein
LRSLSRAHSPLSIEGACNVLELEQTEVIRFCVLKIVRPENAEDPDPLEWRFSMRHLFQLIVAYSMSAMNEDFDRAYAAIRLLEAFEMEVRERIPGFGLPHSMSEPKKLNSAAPFEKELSEVATRGIKWSFGPTLDVTVRENDRLMFMNSSVFTPS